MLHKQDTYLMSLWFSCCSVFKSAFLSSPCVFLFLLLPEM